MVYHMYILPFLPVDPNFRPVLYLKTVGSSIDQTVLQVEMPALVRARSLFHVARRGGWAVQRAAYSTRKPSERKQIDPTSARLPFMLVNPRAHFRDVFGLLTILAVLLSFRAYQDLTAPLDNESDGAQPSEPASDASFVQKVHLAILTLCSGTRCSGV